MFGERSNDHSSNERADEVGTDGRRTDSRELADSYGYELGKDPAAFGLVLESPVDQ